MAHSTSMTVRVMATTALALGVAVFAAPQTTQTKEKVPGAAKFTTSQLKGEVVYLKGDNLIAKMVPSGEYRLFHLRPGKTATIDGAVMPLNKVRLGTVLTAYVTVTEREIIDRTISTLKGTVWYATPTTVVLTLENGENRQYEVPPGLKFDVEGQMKEAMELKTGQKVTATKIVESPYIEVREDNVVIGVGPKT